MARVWSALTSWWGLAVLVVAAFLFGQLLRGGGPPLRDVGQVEGLAAILGDAGAPSRAGAAEAPTLVVFTDYACPNCRADEAALAALAARDRRLTIRWKDWPVLGPRSTEAARAALAAGYQGRYTAMHEALMADLDVATAVRAAGVDAGRLATDLRLHAGEIDARLSRNAAEARALGLPGTPGYLADRWLAVGRVGERGLAQLVATARDAR